MASDSLYCMAIHEEMMAKCQLKVSVRNLQTSSEFFIHMLETI